MHAAILSRPFFFFNDTATTEIYTLSLHDALPISPRSGPPAARRRRSSRRCVRSGWRIASREPDRKSTRLNSSHLGISYAVFCLKKKKKNFRHERSGDACLYTKQRYLQRPLEAEAT